MRVSRRDVFWGYFAQFFSLASGLIVLPAILRLLSTEEVGMNYLMLTVSSMVTLFDFGFAPQFGRNITYVLSGAQELKKEGIDESLRDDREINYHLLANMIATAKYVYKRLAFLVLFVMLSLGSLYIYKVTNGFTNIHNSLFIWIIFSFSTFFNIYFTYYSSLLTGSGKIMEAQKANLFSKFTYVLFVLLFLKIGFGLMGVVLANLLSPFVNRYLSYKWFYTKELKAELNPIVITEKEKKDLFLIIWHNAKKLGLVFIGSHAITRLSMFLAGLYLSLSEIGTFGLMIQLFGIVNIVSGTIINIQQPVFSSLRVKSDNETLLSKFSMSLLTYYFFFICGSICLIFIGNNILDLLNSRTPLPSVIVLTFYSIVLLLEGNHSYFATMIVTKNNVPFVNAALLSGSLIVILSYISLQFTTFGIIGLIIVQGSVQLAYNNWRWPIYVLKEFQISIIAFFRMGLLESKRILTTALL